jgi:diguanylate cyclase (GGDEF)-like protein
MGGVTLEEVESQSQDGFGYLRFSPRVEAMFRQDYVTERVQLAAIWAFVGILIYDLVHFADRMMVPDALTGLVIARFFIFTPIVILCVWAVRRWPKPRLYDTLSVVVAVLGVTLPMLPAIGSNSPHLYVYQTYNTAAFLFFVISLRPRFAAILVGLALMCLAHFVTAYLTGAFDFVAYSGIVSLYLTLSIFLAVSAYFLERMDRRNFLAQLRASLLHDQLQEKAERDELTGLLNRRSLSRLGEIMWRAAGPDDVVSVILLDIDHFKRFNDTHGHIEGDSCIRTVSKCIEENLDPSHSIFRFGGEEILIMAPGIDPVVMFETAEKLRFAIEARRLLHRGAASGRVTASFGVASGNPVSLTLEKLLQKADDALYRAKSSGRNRVVLADQPPTEPQAA